MKTSSKRIFITGFMGAGKTTVASALALRLGCRMIDLDHFIAEREGRTAQQIIDEDGEARFRGIETQALREALLDEEARIIALGGGAWIQEENRELIAKDEGFAIWLDASFELCWRRIAKSVEARPLARDHEQALGLYYSRRNGYGLAHPHIKVDEGKDVEKIVAEIVSSLP